MHSRCLNHVNLCFHWTRQGGGWRHGYPRLSVHKCRHDQFGIRSGEATGCIRSTDHTHRGCTAHHAHAMDQFPMAPYQRPMLCGIWGIVVVRHQLFISFCLVGEMCWLNFQPFFTCFQPFVSIVGGFWFVMKGNRPTTSTSVEQQEQLTVVGGCAEAALHFANKAIRVLTACCARCSARCNVSPAHTIYAHTKRC